MTEFSAESTFALGNQPRGQKCAGETIFGIREIIRWVADSKNGETIKEGYVVQLDRRSAGHDGIKRT